MGNSAHSLREEGIPAVWLQDPELLRLSEALEEEALREQARLDDAAARNRAVLHDLFDGTAREYTWEPRAINKKVLRRPRAAVNDELQPHLVMPAARRRYTKERERNFQDFRGLETLCLVGLLEASLEDFSGSRPGTPAFFDAWLWMRIPEPAWKAFSFACCCDAAGADPDVIRSEAESNLRAKLGEDVYRQLLRQVIELAIAEASQNAVARGTWHEIAALRDELIELT
ncbi:MAG TPA: hypothetical protein PLN91_00745 [Rhodanobacteraceae bacterium]|nr:hypothetical protein [Rhodanobacteraceae bacterium]